MITGVVSFLCGILFLQQWATLPALAWSWLLAGLLFYPLLTKTTTASLGGRLLRITLFFLAGFAWALLRAHWVLDVALPGELQGKDLLATGTIVSIPVQDSNKQRFEFQIETLEHNKADIPFNAKVRLNWYHNRPGKKKSASKRKPELKAGQRWRFWIRLKQPHGFMNPGGFDYEGWLYQKNIRATGYVRIKPKQKKFAVLLDGEADSVNLLVLRQRLYQKIHDLTIDNQFAGILIALAMGERSTISHEQWQIFRATGISHLVAISGLHIGLLAGLVFFISRKLWALAGNAPLLLAAPRAAALLALLAASFYAALSGFAIPAQRALMMLSVVMLSIYSRHKVQTSHVVSLALLCVLIVDPVAVMSPGFWLSFFAVLVIAASAFGRINIERKWLSWGRLQWRISLLLIPLLIFLFQQASFTSPVANLIAIPVVSLIIVPLVLFATAVTSLLPDVSIWLYSLSDNILQVVWWLMRYLSDTPLSQWYGVKSDILSLILATTGIALLLTPKGWPFRYFGLFMIIPMFWPYVDSVRRGEVEFTLLDVGQGLSAVVQTQRHVLLFDTGARFNEKFDTGDAVVLPFLRQKNIPKLDMLIVSHKDNDHRGGLDSIQSEMSVGRLLSSYGEKGSEPCRAGQNWNWDGVTFEILNPAATVRYKNRNNASCVLRISAGPRSILLTADIEKQAEHILLQTRPDQLKATYLVAPHHGSKTSSSNAFLEAVSPEYVLVPVGYRNRYRMPHHSILARYQEHGLIVLESYRTGAISFRIGQKTSSIIPHKYRQQTQKYWHSRH